MVVTAIVAFMGGPANGWVAFAIVVGIIAGFGLIGALLRRR
jgi:hypothetical protein